MSNVDLTPGEIAGLRLLLAERGPQITLLHETVEAMLDEIERRRAEEQGWRTAMFESGQRTGAARLRAIYAEARVGDLERRVAELEARPPTS